MSETQSCMCLFRLVKVFVNFSREGIRGLVLLRTAGHGEIRGHDPAARVSPWAQRSGTRPQSQDSTPVQNKAKWIFSEIFYFSQPGLIV